MYKILSKQKKRVQEGKYDKDSFIFLVNQAYEKNKITEEQKNELIEFNDGSEVINEWVWAYTAFALKQNSIEIYKSSEVKNEWWIS